MADTSSFTYLYQISTLTTAMYLYSSFIQTSEGRHFYFLDPPDRVALLEAIKTTRVSFMRHGLKNENLSKSLFYLHPNVSSCMEHDAMGVMLM
ncbi:hypothetical protein CEXT_405491 [Caerostris extrusa]|uniref:Uncharacterized protein n=1 Tax=Caerostris extrusa TaxID=172846 RepID=A0AAV4NX61_CAEEX|nr:hypothetical protein CEXT_405491 [Caerostris extrusa]